MADLEMDLDALDDFSARLARVRGQWVAGASLSQCTAFLVGDKDLTGALDDFDARWHKAAETMNTYVDTLASMCSDTMAKFRQLDADLAGRAMPGRGHMIVDSY